MRRHLLSLFLFGTVLMTTSAYSETADRQATLSIPPASLEQWYKPANKRQVWLHTMFRLRRSMQAVSQYAALEEPELLAKWSESLVKDYRSIGDMVPEWRDELELEWADRLLTSAKAMDVDALARAQRKLGSSCSGCHKEYRAVTAALYRAPDFSMIQVEDQETMEELSYEDTMQGLSTSMNRIVIALADQRLKDAQTARAQLIARLNNLGGSCAACHQDESLREQVLGQPSMDKLEQLGKLIEANKIKESQKSIGEIAVTICASCHGTHRTLSDLRQFIIKSE